MAAEDRPSPKECVEGFSLWMWSFPFLVTIRWHGVDVLPDSVGFLFMAMAVGRFRRFHRLLPQIRLLASLLALTSLFTVYVRPQSAPIYVDVSDLGMVAVFVNGLLASVLVWWLCQVVADFARRVHAGDTVRAADMRRFLFVGLQVAAMTALVLARVSGDTGSVLVLGVVFGGIAIVGLLMELMLQARHLCGGSSEFSMPIPETAPQEAGEAAPFPSRS